MQNTAKRYEFELYTNSLHHRMDPIVAAGGESAEQSQPHSRLLALPPILSRTALDLPALRAAEEALTRAVFDCAGLLTGPQQLLLLAAAGRQWHADIRDIAIPCFEDSHGCGQDALAQFSLKLARYGPWCCRADCDELRAAGFNESAIVAAVTTVALGHFRCSLAAALLGRDGLPFELQSDPTEPIPQWRETPAPFISTPPPPTEALDSALDQIRALFGFVPNLIHLQSWIPNLVRAEIHLLEAVFGPEDCLSQMQKHRLALCLAAANCSNYLMALHGEMLNLIGSTPEETLALLDDAGVVSVLEADKALCSEAKKLTMLRRTGNEQFDPKLLTEAGFSPAHIVETAVTAALTNFLCTIGFGLGAVPDFVPVRTFHAKDLYLSADESRPTQNEFRLEDPDREFVARVRAGETDAFEHLVRSHTGRVFRTLYGILGNPEEARDATQDTFLKVFEHIDKFERRSKFSTWLTSIAVNTGIEILRRRRPLESIHSEDGELGFRPRQVRSWVDNPEQVLEKSQTNSLVRKAVLRLPEKYRAALLLRDINQLSTEDTAEALGLSLPATKARILRGRLMLRESLAPHFTRTEGGQRV